MFRIAAFRFIWLLPSEAGEETRKYSESILQQESVSVLLNPVLYEQLREVEEALDRLNLGEYGDT